MRRTPGHLDALLLTLALAAAADIVRARRKAHGDAHTPGRARQAASRAGLPDEDASPRASPRPAACAARPDAGPGAAVGNPARAHDDRNGIRACAAAWPIRARGIADALVLTLALAAAAADIATASASTLRLVLSGLAALLVPGAAVLLFLRPRELVEAAAAAIGVSLAVEVIGSLILVWAGWFHPVVLAGAIALPSGIALAWDCWRCLLPREQAATR